MQHQKNQPPDLAAVPLPEGMAPEAGGLFSVLTSTCDQDGWDTEFENASLSEGARLTIQSSTAEERHPLTAIHPHGYWSRWRMSLPVVAVEEQASGVSTRLECRAALTWIVERLNAGGEPIDCTSWGVEAIEC